MFSPVFITIQNVLSHQTNTDNRLPSWNHKIIRGLTSPMGDKQSGSTPTSLPHRVCHETPTEQTQLRQSELPSWALITCTFKEKGSNNSKQEQKAEHTALQDPDDTPNHSRINNHNENTDLILSEELYVMFLLHIEQKQTGAKQKKISCSWKPCGKNRNQRNLTFLFSSGKERIQS